RATAALVTGGERRKAQGEGRSGDGFRRIGDPFSTLAIRRSPFALRPFPHQPQKQHHRSGGKNQASDPEDEREVERHLIRVRRPRGPFGAKRTPGRWSSPPPVEDRPRGPCRR